MQTRANYDRLSGWYDLLAGGSERKYRDQTLRRVAVQPGERVLEVGSGTGQALVALGRKAGRPDWRRLGIDLSEGMCRVARGKIASATPPLPHGDELSAYAAEHVTDADFALDRQLPDGMELGSKEELLYYRIFREHFGEFGDLSWTGRL